MRVAVPEVIFARRRQGFPTGGWVPPRTKRTRAPTGPAKEVFLTALVNEIGAF